MRRTRKHLEPKCDVQEMSVTTTKQRPIMKTATLRAYSRVHQVFYVTAHIVRFHVVLRVDRLLRAVDGVLVAVIVHSICVPNSCTFHIAKTGLLRCCLHIAHILVVQCQSKFFLQSTCIQSKRIVFELHF